MIATTAPRRVLIIGSGGSGKTTLSRQLASRTGLPVIHLDQLFWHPGWVPTPDDEWDQLIDELTRRDAWIMDGNYGRTLARRVAAADTIIYLDVPAHVSLWRIVKRRLTNRGRARDDVAPGCPERLNWEFVHWVWTFRTRRRPGILRLLAAVRDDQQVIILKQSRDIRALLESISA